MKYNRVHWLALLNFLFDGNIPEGKDIHWSESALCTDGYKYSMYLGGRPFDREASYLSFRKGGRMFMPVDIPTVIKEVCPDPDKTDFVRDAAFLKDNGFPVTVDMPKESAYPERADILYYTPKGETCDPREPMLTWSDSQALVSYVEPLLVGRLSYQTQVATAAMDNPWYDFIHTISRVTCEEQKRLTLEALVGAGFKEKVGGFITVDMQGYYEAVKEQCRKLLATGVDPSRFFEVGLRAATCMEQHLIALKALKDMGFTCTSNVYGAWLLGLKPVGTLGHEGIGRWGGDDELAFRKHIAALAKVTFLLDTTDTLRVGMPLAFRLFKEFPERMDSARPDSGDLELQFRAWDKGLKDNGISPHPWIFEDGLDHLQVDRFERLRRELNYPANMTLYGLGGYFIDQPEFTGYGRGRINMIYKLSWTAMYGPTMKFGNEEEKKDSGKQSLPGLPILVIKDNGFDIMVCQHEHIPAGYRKFGPGDTKYRKEKVAFRPKLDDLTQQYIDACKAQREKAIQAGFISTVSA